MTMKRIRTRPCICSSATQCTGMSIAFQLLEDPRGGYVEIPSFSPNPGGFDYLHKLNLLREAYFRYLDDDNTANDDANGNSITRVDPRFDGELQYVALHHFHPRVVRDVAEANDRSDNQHPRYQQNRYRQQQHHHAPQIPFFLKASEVKRFRLQVSETDRVRDIQGLPTDEFLFVPNYHIDDAHRDLRQLSRAERSSADITNKVYQDAKMAILRKQQQKEVGKELKTSSNVKRVGAAAGEVKQQSQKYPKTNEPNTTQRKGKGRDKEKYNSPMRDKKPAKKIFRHNKGNDEMLMDSSPDRSKQARTSFTPTKRQRTSVSLDDMSKDSKDIKQQETTKQKGSGPMSQPAPDSDTNAAANSAQKESHSPMQEKVSTRNLMVDYSNKTVAPIDKSEASRQAQLGKSNRMISSNMLLMNESAVSLHISDPRLSLPATSNMQDPAVTTVATGAGPMMGSASSKMNTSDSTVQASNLAGKAAGADTATSSAATSVATSVSSGKKMSSIDPGLTSEEIARDFPLEDFLPSHRRRLPARRPDPPAGLLSRIVKSSNALVSSTSQVPLPTKNDATRFSTRDTVEDQQPSSTIKSRPISTLRGPVFTILETAADGSSASLGPIPRQSDHEKSNDKEPMSPFKNESTGCPKPPIDTSPSMPRRMNSARNIHSDCESSEIETRQGSDQTSGQKPDIFPFKAIQKRRQSNNVALRKQNCGSHTAKRQRWSAAAELSSLLDPQRRRLPRRTISGSSGSSSEAQAQRPRRRAPRRRYTSENLSESKRRSSHFLPRPTKSDSTPRRKLNGPRRSSANGYLSESSGGSKSLLGAAKTIDSTRRAMQQFSESFVIHDEEEGRHYLPASMRARESPKGLRSGAGSMNVSDSSMGSSNKRRGRRGAMVSEQSGATARRRGVRRTKSADDTMDIALTSLIAMKNFAQGKKASDISPGVSPERQSPTAPRRGLRPQGDAGPSQKLANKQNGRLGRTRGRSPPMRTMTGTNLRAMHQHTNDSRIQTRNMNSGMADPSSSSPGRTRKESQRSLSPLVRTANGSNFTIRRIDSSRRAMQNFVLQDSSSGVDGSGRHSPSRTRKRLSPKRARSSAPTRPRSSSRSPLRAHEMDSSSPAVLAPNSRSGALEKSCLPDMNNSSPAILSEPAVFRRSNSSTRGLKHSEHSDAGFYKYGCRFPTSPSRVKSLSPYRRRMASQSPKRVHDTKRGSLPSISKSSQAKQFENQRAESCPALAAKKSDSDNGIRSSTTSLFTATSTFTIAGKSETPDGSTSTHCNGDAQATNRGASSCTSYAGTEMSLSGFEPSAESREESNPEMLSLNNSLRLEDLEVNELDDKDNSLRLDKLEEKRKQAIRDLIPGDFNFSHPIRRNHDRKREVDWESIGFYASFPARSSVFVDDLEGSTTFCLPRKLFGRDVRQQLLTEVVVAAHRRQNGAAKQEEISAKAKRSENQQLVTHEMLPEWNDRSPVEAPSAEEMLLLHEENEVAGPLRKSQSTRDDQNVSKKVSTGPTDLKKFGVLFPFRNIREKRRKSPTQTTSSSSSDEREQTSKTVDKDDQGSIEPRGDVTDTSLPSLKSGTAKDFSLSSTENGVTKLLGASQEAIDLKLRLRRLSTSSLAGQTIASDAAVCVESDIASIAWTEFSREKSEEEEFSRASNSLRDFSGDTCDLARDAASSTSSKNHTSRTKSACSAAGSCKKEFSLQFHSSSETRSTNMLNNEAGEFRLAFPPQYTSPSRSLPNAGLCLGSESETSLNVKCGRTGDSLDRKIDGTAASILYFSDEGSFGKAQLRQNKQSPNRKGIWGANANINKRKSIRNKKKKSPNEGRAREFEVQRTTLSMS